MTNLCTTGNKEIPPLNESLNSCRNYTYHNFLVFMNSGKTSNKYYKSEILSYKTYFIEYDYIQHT